MARFDMTVYSGIADWELAKGSCGFNLGNTPVYAAYVNGVALFAWTTRYGLLKGKHNCVITGQMTCGGETLESAKRNGVVEAQKWGVLESDQRYSRAKFRAIVDSPIRLKIR